VTLDATCYRRNGAHRFIPTNHEIYEHKEPNNNNKLVSLKEEGLICMYSCSIIVCIKMIFQQKPLNIKNIQYDPYTGKNRDKKNYL
jgi:hypothetical protein